MKKFIVSTQALFIFFFLLSVSTSLFWGCNSQNNDSESTGKTNLPEEKNRVDGIVIKKQDFPREIISNGKLSAKQKAELYFKTQGIIQDIPVKNGEAVRKSQIIASLEKEDLLYNLQKAELGFEKAGMNRKDALLSMGYTGDTLTDIREEHIKIANIRSGYTEAELALKDARRQLGFAEIRAPFDGIMEGIKQKPFEKANLAVPFCSLLNNQWFEVQFPLLETEISRVHTGQAVEVFPLGVDFGVTGNITEKNPRIDENGLIWLKAEIKNPGGYMDGMNVKIRIKEIIPDQLIVPKQAVVLRQDREVLFRYTGGIAYWTYINILDENEDSYSVVAAEGASLNPGDTVIISNNLNLAHESAVEISN
jgi:membrane fusion protein, multidrug efflux system